MSRTEPLFVQNLNFKVRSQSRGSFACVSVMVT